MSAKKKIADDFFFKGNGRSCIAKTHYVIAYLGFVIGEEFEELADVRGEARRLPLVAYNID